MFNQLQKQKRFFNRTFIQFYKQVISFIKIKQLQFNKILIFSHLVIKNLKEAFLKMQSFSLQFVHPCCHPIHLRIK
jgi:hypothetical protein